MDTEQKYITPCAEHLLEAQKAAQESRLRFLAYLIEMALSEALAMGSSAMIPGDSSHVLGGVQGAVQ